METSSESIKKVTFITIFILLIGIFVAWKSNKVPNQNNSTIKQLKYIPIVLNKWNPNDNLRTVKRVLDRLGYQMVNDSNEPWDLMWSIEFPYDRFLQKLNATLPHQRINHIPGMPFLTNKMYLAMTARSKFIPIAFEFPKLKNEFIYYKKMNPNKKFVIKNFDNRGVKVITHNTIDYDMGQFKFVQEFIDNPLLIDERAFDLGVFVVITSVDPLRMYRYKGDAFIRICPEPYHPFDPENIEKYVIYETHLSYWETPSLQVACETFNFSALDAFNYYLNNNDHDSVALWEQIDEAIVEIVHMKTPHMARHIDRTPINASYFELLRFDFIVDDELNVHLIEINMSPNLTPTNQKSEKYNLMYEQLVYNTIELVGLGSYSDARPESIDEASMHSALKNIAVNVDECLNANCSNECESDECDLCLNCISDDTIEHLKKSYREHQRRGDMKRIFPIDKYSNEINMKFYTEQTKISMKWFQAMCWKDPDWC